MKTIRLGLPLALCAAALAPIAACSSGPQASTLGTVSEVARAQTFVDARYTVADVEHSFHTPFGQTIDCVDFFAQPGVKALAARGTPILERPRPAKQPTFAPGDPLAAAAFDGSIDEDGNARTCSETSVPEVRLTVAEIMNLGGLDRYLAHLGRKAPYGAQSENAPPDSAGPQYAHAQSAYSGSSTFLATRATLSVWTPAIPASDTSDHSLEQTWTMSAGTNWTSKVACAPNCRQTVEAGWTVDPGLNGDGNPHLFIFSTANGYQTGCYNGGSGSSCLPWIATPKAPFAPGMTLGTSSATTSPPTMAELIVQVTACSTTGNCSSGWEVQVRTNNNGTTPLAEVGYYPASDFTGSFQTTATAFSAGGEVYDNRDFNPVTEADTFLLPMGNGNVSSAGYGKAAYVHDFEIFPTGAGDPTLTPFGAPGSSEPQYGVTPQTTPIEPGTPESDAGWLDYFYLGAPPPACVPQSCAAQGLSCGAAADGCGDSLECGTCASGDLCTSGKCVACVPVTCFSAANRECGSVANGCGGTLECGSCASGMACENGECVGGGGTGGTTCTECKASGGICSVVDGKSVCIHE